MKPLQPATAETFPPRQDITPEMASSLKRHGIARGPLSLDPKQRLVVVLPSKLDEIIQKAQGRAAPVFRNKIKLYEKLIQLLQREIAATKKLTQLYLNQ